MATNQFKKINAPKANAAEVHKHNWSVMMPFIRFGIGALQLIGHTLIHIVKQLPGLRDERPKSKSRNVIKVKQ